MDIKTYTILPKVLGHPLLMKGLTLNANALPNTNDIWVQSFHTLQNCCNRGGNIIFKYINYVSIFVGSAFFSSKEGGFPVLLSI